MKKITTLLLITLLASCSTQVTNEVDLKPSDPKFISSQKNLDKLEKFQITGQIGIISTKGKGSLSFQLNVQDKNNFILNLQAPLGIKKFELIKTKNNLTFIDEDNDKPITSNDADDLIYQLLGVNLPLNEILNWLKGVSRAKNIVINENGTIREIKNNIKGENFVIEYLKYNDNFLPQLIIIRNNSEQIKLKISKWIL